MKKEDKKEKPERPLVKLQSIKGERHYWGKEEYCELGIIIREFVALRKKRKDEDPFRYGITGEITEYLNECLFSQDYEGFHLFARLFEIAVQEQGIRPSKWNVGYAYDEAQILSGINPPLKRHVKDALKIRPPNLSNSSLYQQIDDFAEFEGVGFSQEEGRKKGGRPLKGSGLYEVAEVRLLVDLDGDEKHIVESLLIRAAQKSSKSKL